MNSLRISDADRGPDGKILTFDQLLADTRQAMSAPAPTADTPPTEVAPALKQPASKAEQALLLVVALIVIGIAVYRFGVGGDVAPAAPSQAPATAQTSGDSTAIASPIPAVMLPAFAAPDVPLGSIEATRAITPVAHFGDDWIQADVSGSGRIWLRASDWPALAIVGPDLAPRRAAPAPAAAPAPFVPEATPPPPLEPPCAAAGIPGKMVEVCGYEELRILEARAKELWLSTYGGNIGIVGTPSPQIVRTP